MKFESLLQVNVPTTGAREGFAVFFDGETLDEAHEAARAWFMRLVEGLGGGPAQNQGTVIEVTVNGWGLRFFPHWPRTGGEVRPVWSEDEAAQLRTSPPTAEEVVENDLGVVLTEARKVGFDIEALRCLLWRIPSRIGSRGNRGRLFVRAAIDQLLSGACGRELALMAGVNDKSYSTVRYGWVPAYSGEGVIVFPDGRRVLARGYNSRGDAQVLSREGGVTYTLLS